MCQANRGNWGIEKLGDFLRFTQLVNGGAIVTKTHNPKHALDALSPSIFGTESPFQIQGPSPYTLKTSSINHRIQEKHIFSCK